MSVAILITGSNSGRREDNITRARALIIERVGDAVASSRVMESEPWGEVAPEGAARGKADNFLNQVVAVETALGPERLLDALQRIEKELGRDRGVREEGKNPERDVQEECENREKATRGECRNAAERAARRYLSRSIDIDILFYDRMVLDTPRLTIPHPLLGQREFVLRPLMEAMPRFRHPVSGKTARELLAELENKGND